MLQLLFFHALSRHCGQKRKVWSTERVVDFEGFTLICSTQLATLLRVV